jgi:hypothetical protein
MLQAQRRAAPYWFLESAKLTKATEPLRALQELEHALRSSSQADDQENRKLKAKVTLYPTCILRSADNPSGSRDSCPLDE